MNEMKPETSGRTRLYACIALVAAIAVFIVYVVNL